MPASRVQHVDLKHGPLERRFKLATLVVHTAAVHLSGITVRGLDDADAQRLRDALALLDIRVLDHFIVGDGGCLSFAERGLI